jgi:N-acetylmuramoyl-L-alanine amidase
MVQSRFCKGVLIVTAVSLVLACGCDIFRQRDFQYAGYSGPVDCASHSWLRGRKIFIDAGHGGLGASDPFRIGPGGVTEESVNLRVSVMLEDMLRKAGAQTVMSRTADVDVSLDERVAMVEKAAPDILVSVHHNGSSRRSDGVNYSSVFVHGTAETSPASHDFARCLSGEFSRLIEAPSLVVSDYSVFQETGMRILRKTANLCPGVIGEGGFFSDEKQAIHLKDPQYNEKEAEAYFIALSGYFRSGTPSASVHFSSPADSSGCLPSVNGEAHPDIFIKVNPGGEHPGVKEDSFRMTLDDIPVRVRRCGENIFRVDYGRALYAGGHRLRFSFRNYHNNSSMVMKSGFIVAIGLGDFSRLWRRGRSLVYGRGDVTEGLRMICSAYSMEPAGPDTRAILRDMVYGFSRLGLHDRAAYYRQADRLFHHASRGLSFISEGERESHFPVRFHGRDIPVKFGSNPLTDPAR